jgi:hypothetical protein
VVCVVPPELAAPTRHEAEEDERDVIDAFVGSQAHYALCVSIASMLPGERVLSRVDQTAEGCWEYHGTPSQRYPQVWDGERHRNIPAHVAVWIVTHGRRPPADHDVHHRCENRRCVRPKHLVLLDSFTHNSMHHTKTMCAHGHAYTPENTIMRRGQKTCRICAAAAAKRYNERRRHQCADCETTISIRATRCHPCHAKHIGFGTLVGAGRAVMSE